MISVYKPAVCFGNEKARHFRFHGSDGLFRVGRTQGLLCNPPLGLSESPIASPLPPVLSDGVESF